MDQIKNQAVIYVYTGFRVIDVGLEAAGGVVELHITLRLFLNHDDKLIQNQLITINDQHCQGVKCDFCNA